MPASPAENVTGDHVANIASSAIDGDYAGVAENIIDTIGIGWVASTVFGIFKKPKVLLVVAAIGGGYMFWKSRQDPSDQRS